MKNLNFRVLLNGKSFGISYDPPKHKNCRLCSWHGWSVSINGKFYVEFYKNPLAAVWTAIRRHRDAERDMAESERAAAARAPEVIE